MVVRSNRRSGFVAVLLGLAVSPIQAQPSPDPGEEGPLTVRVAYSVHLRQRPGWHSQFGCAVSRAEELLRPVTGRGLEVRGRVPWLAGSQPSSLHDLRALLVDQVEAGKADLVVGLATGQSQTLDSPNAPTDNRTEDEGLASYTHGYLVLRVGDGDLCHVGRLLAHELAHIFGGVHRRGGGYLMDRSGTGSDIDPLNAELFALHRGRRFGPDQAPLDDDSLRAMWRLSSADLDDAATWVVVGALAARMGKPGAAMDYYRRAIDLDDEHSAAFVNLGHACFQTGDLEAAEKHYGKALELGSEQGVVYNNLAAIHYSRGAYPQAAESLRRALALDYPVNPQFTAEIEKVLGEKALRP